MQRWVIIGSTVQHCGERMGSVRQDDGDETICDITLKQSMQSLPLQIFLIHHRMAELCAFVVHAVVATI
jgi:hypothetical protein